MVDTSTNLPQAVASDAAEVTLALATAHELWAKGLALESVRWIQRAAENAESAGNDLRAVSLARAAADLRAEVSVASEPAGPVTEAAALAPYDDFTESTIVDSPASTLARVAIQSTTVQIAELQPSSAPVSSGPVSSAPVSSGPASSGPVSSATLSVAPTPPAPMVHSASVFAQHQTLRGYLIPGAPGSRDLTLRLLEEGEVPPMGAIVALLTTLDPKAKLV